MLTPRQTAIKKLVEDRKIPYLVHFTRSDNLDSILLNGLYSRESLGDITSEGNNPITNDEIRLDNKPGYNSLSISFPNYKMFYSCRQSSDADWVVLVLRPSILWEKDCLFYPTNAASASVSHMPITNFQSAEALLNMFNSDQTDERNGLEAHDPTDVQAEVMVYGRIEPSYIGCCLFEKAALKDRFLKKFPDRKMFLHSSFYSNRAYARSGGFKR